MCGSTQTQNNLSNEEASFMSQLQGQYQQEFGQNQTILNSLTSALTPIIAGGPSQNLFSPQETAALNTQAEQGAANSYSQTLQATKEQMEAAGGGNTYVPSGVEGQIEGEIGVSAENNLANQKLGITESGYQAGLNEYNDALGLLSGVPSAIENPLSTSANATSNSGNTANSEANAVEQANNSWMGLLGGVASTAITGLTGIPMGSSSSSGSGGIYDSDGNYMGE